MTWSNEATTEIQETQTDMQPHDINHFFNTLTFQKTTQEIVSKINEKISKVKSKIEERQRRVNDLRSQYNITDAALIDLLQQARNDMNNGCFGGKQFYNTRTSGQEQGGKELTIGAGLVNNLLTENDFITAERDQITRLELISRNLRDVQKTTTQGASYIELHELTYAELDFLGF